MHLVGLAGENRHPRLQVGRLYVSNQAPLESGAQAFLHQRQLARRAVGRHHHLVARVVQVVEGVKKALVSLLFATEKLHVVHQQHIHRAETLAELLGSAGAYGRDELVGELLRGDVQHRHPPQGAGTSHRLEQVRLAQSGPGVEKQGVVGHPRRLGHRLGRAEGQPVGRADHEGLEGVARVQRTELEQRLVCFLAHSGRKPGPFLITGFDGVGNPLGLDLQVQLERTARHLLQRALQGMEHPPLQPLHGKGRRRFDDERLPVIGYPFGGLQPGLEGRAGQLHLQVAQHGPPDLAG